MTIWIAIAAVIVLASIGTLVLMKKRKAMPDYRTIFSLGFVFIFTYFIDIFTKYVFSPTYEVTSVFLLLGITYIVVGFLNRDKWGKKKK